MTDGFRLANTQWQTGTNDGTTMSEPTIEEMTDRADRIVGVEMVPDLSTFTEWLKLQPISTRVSLLHALANDLFAEGWGGVGYEIRKAAEDLHTLTRHEGAV